VALPTYVAVVGAGACDEETAVTAEEVGTRLGEAGAVGFRTWKISGVAVASAAADAVQRVLR
jgi:hypothetical protein